MYSNYLTTDLGKNYLEAVSFFLKSGIKIIEIFKLKQKFVLDSPFD